MSAKRSSEPSPGAFWFLCRHGQRNSPPAGGEIPLRKEPSSGPMRASGPTKKRSIIAPSSVTASPCHLPPKGKAFKGSPLIRPLRGHLSLSPLSLRDIIPTPFGLRPFPLTGGIGPLTRGVGPQGEGFGGEGPSFVPGGRLEKCGGKLPCEKTDKEMMLCRPKPYRSTPNSSSSRTF